MPIAGNLRISNKFLLTAPNNGISFYPNCPRHILINHPSKNLNHNSIRNYETTSQDPVKSKVAIITNGIKGMGYQIADQLLKADAKAVILADEKLEDMENITSKLNKKYGESRALFQQIDVTKKEDMYKLFKSAKNRFKKLDLVINNADVKINTQGEIYVNSNVTSMVQSTFLGFQEMFKTGGVILNTAAILQREPMNGLPIFNSTNHFLIGFTKNLGRNFFYKPTNVKVMAICPCSSDDIVNGIYLEEDDLLNEDINKDNLIENMARKPKNHFARFPCQSSEEIGKVILEVLTDNENGSVWIAEPGNAYKIQINKNFCLPPTDNAYFNQINIEPKVDPKDSSLNEMSLDKRKKIRRDPEDPFDYGCQKKKPPRKPPKMRDPMKPKAKGYVPKKDPCGKYKKKRKGGKPRKEKDVCKKKKNKK